MGWREQELIELYAWPYEKRVPYIKLRSDTKEGKRRIMQGRIVHRAPPTNPDTRRVVGRILRVEDYALCCSNIGENET
jgi:hypothetical protein